LGLADNELLHTKGYWKFNRSEELSFRRTFKILRKLGLIEGWKRQMSWGIAEYPSYKLTDKGKKLAEKIEKDILGFVEEYEHLVRGVSKLRRD
jgi:hypothetical protein